MKETLLTWLMLGLVLGALILGIAQTLLPLYLIIKLW